MINRVIVSGRLTRDAELKYTTSGTAIMSFSIATNDYQGKDREEATYFFECYGFGERWEKINQYLSKGSKLIVEGKLVQQSWVDKNGSKKSTIKIQIDNVDFCGGSKNNQGTTSQKSQSAPAHQEPAPSIDIDEEDIPF